MNNVGLQILKVLDPKAEPDQVALDPVFCSLRQNQVPTDKLSSLRRKQVPTDKIKEQEIYL